MSTIRLRPDITILRVGGAVRDELLGYAYDETDWVVIGANPSDLLDAGFNQVGNNFPVFLHPETNEEYALARTERKSGKGYNGFTIHADPSVTLEEDLYRRDLTINAMARSTDGSLIDPYHGEKDLREKKLRHVSNSFIEDPLRVFRVCRFAARYQHLGFTVAEETMDLMRSMVGTGELSELAPDRIWRETERALCEQNPEIFFSLLHELGGAVGQYPFTVGIDALTRLTHARKHFGDSLRRWGALTGSDFSPEVPYRAAIPKRHLAMANLGAIALEHGAPTSAEDALALLEKLDAFRQGSLCDDVLDVIGGIDPHFSAANLSRIHETRKIAESIGGREFAEIGLQGSDIKNAITAKRIAATAHLF